MFGESEMKKIASRSSKAEDISQKLIEFIKRSQLCFASMGGEKVKLGKLRNSRLTKHTMDVSRKYIDLENQSLSQRNLLNRSYSLRYDPLQAASFPV